MDPRLNSKLVNIVFFSDSRSNVSWFCHYNLGLFCNCTLFCRVSEIFFRPLCISSPVALIKKRKNLILFQNESNVVGYVIPPPQGTTFNTKTGVLAFAPPSGNAGDYCARIDIGDSFGVWTNYTQCQAFNTRTTVVLPSDLNVFGLRLSFCLVRRHEMCSQWTVAKLGQIK